MWYRFMSLAGYLRVGSVLTPFEGVSCRDAIYRVLVDQCLYFSIFVAELYSISNWQAVIHRCRTDAPDSYSSSKRCKGAICHVVIPPLKSSLMGLRFMTV